MSVLAPKSTCFVSPFGSGYHKLLNMADNYKLELVVKVDVNKANAPIKSVNTKAHAVPVLSARERRCTP
jgi:hypothetical protein